MRSFSLRQFHEKIVLLSKAKHLVNVQIVTKNNALKIFSF